MDNDRKIKEALRYKEMGNELFKEGKFKKAITKYATVLAYVNGLPGSKKGMVGITKMAANALQGEEMSNMQEDEASELEKIAYQNIAVCHLRLNNPKEALVQASKALLIDPKSWKAYLRKGEAFVMLQDFDNARGWLDCATSAIKATIRPKAGESRRMQEAAKANAQSALMAVERERVKMNLLQKEYDNKQKKRYAGMFGEGGAASSEAAEAAAGSGSGNGAAAASASSGSSGSGSSGSGSDSTTSGRKNHGQGAVSSSSGNISNPYGCEMRSGRDYDGFLADPERDRRRERMLNRDRERRREVEPGDDEEALKASSGGGSSSSSSSTAATSAGGSASSGGSSSRETSGGSASGGDDGDVSPTGSGSGSGSLTGSGRRASRATGSGDDENM